MGVVHEVGGPRPISGPYEERRKFFEGLGWVFSFKGGEKAAVKGGVKVVAACMRSLLNRVQAR